MSLRVPALERFAIFLLAVCQLAQETFLYRGVAILGPLNRLCTTVKFRALIHFRLPPVTWSQHISSDRRARSILASSIFFSNLKTRSNRCFRQREQTLKMISLRFGLGFVSGVDVVQLRELHMSPRNAQRCQPVDSKKSLERLVLEWDGGWWRRMPKPVVTHKDSPLPVDFLFRWTQSTGKAFFPLRAW